MSMIGRFLPACLIVTAILVSGCVQQQENAPGKGLLEGRITIGPICPVERMPPDPSCQPTEETYRAHKLSVYTESPTKVAEFSGDANGRYKIELAAGTYTIKTEREMGPGGMEPITVTVEAGKTTRQDVDIDTGIR